jgi:hypothetical protein
MGESANGRQIGGAGPSVKRGDPGAIVKISRLLPVRLARDEAQMNEPIPGAFSGAVS